MKKEMLLIAVLLFATPLTCVASGDNLGVTVVSKKCGGAEMSLRCTAVGHGMADCLHPSLVYRSRGAIRRLPLPRWLKDSSPTGIACVVSKSDNTSYFHVMYSVLPMGCDVCEWHHLYDTNGHLLTESDPATIKVSNVAPAQSITSNNRSFDGLSKKLNLGAYEDEDIVCEGAHIDGKGNLLCHMRVK
ncbi:hypothetical protein [Dyella psychrodurans]|uniref:hypothetical protein n=1 Tax=Dyella psychrodurans TaxID=1927960 RepID=UPI0011C08076|nr:hypothetical protein [Dyella psychrodurans]